MRKPTAEHLAWFPVRYSLDHGQVIVHLPHGPVICGPDPYEAAKTLASYWVPGAGVEKVDIPCTCGQRKAGYPDFSRAHSSWCNHTPVLVKDPPVYPKPNGKDRFVLSQPVNP